MATGGNTQQSFRKALGALKDTTKVGLAKVNSEYKDLDIAIVKATNHLEVPPKEKHVRTIFNALSASRSQTDFAYCMHALARRLAKTSSWAVALKTLIIIHRALREMVPPIHEELIGYCQRRDLVLNMSHFKDDSTPNAWEYSTWVRTYALYLEERLECLRILEYDVVKDSSRIKELCIPDLLDQLPSLQQLLFRLLACQPEGANRYNSLIKYTLATIAAESVHIYVATTAGTLNLVDKFFEMQRHDAVRALEIYRKAGEQGEKLSEFFEICRGFEFGSGSGQYIKIEKLPASFMTAMEDYVKEAPKPLLLHGKGNNDEISTTPKETAASGPDFRTPLPRSFPRVSDSDDMGITKLTAACGPSFKTDHKHDNKVLDDSAQDSAKVDDENSLNLAIATPDDLPSLNSSSPSSESSSWEVALVATPSSNGEEDKVAGGFDTLTLNSLYGNATTEGNQNDTHHMGLVSSNPFVSVQYSEYPDQSLSSSVEPEIMAQQQQKEGFS